MNIFVLDLNPILAAQYHCDEHVGKMIIEAGQLLCSAHWTTGSEAPYKLTHKNHPCAKWVRGGLGCYQWLCRLGLALAEEFEFRRNKKHKSGQVIEWALSHPPDLPEGGHPFFLAMPEQYHQQDAVEAYRAFYIGEKRFATWKWGRKAPFWWR